MRRAGLLLVALALLGLVASQLAVAQPAALKTVYIQSGADFARALSDNSVGTLMLPNELRLLEADVNSFSDSVIVVTRNYTMQGTSASR